MHALPPEPPKPESGPRGPITMEDARQEVADLLLKFLNQRWATYLGERLKELGPSSVPNLDAAYREAVRHLHAFTPDGPPKNRQQRRAARKKARRR